eukprot:jgi/Bigna1/143521/aug1.79_g18229
MGSQTRHNSTAANFNLSFAASNHNGETRRGHETKEVFETNTSSRYREKDGGGVWYDFDQSLGRKSEKIHGKATFNAPFSICDADIKRPQFRTKPLLATKGAIAHGISMMIVIEKKTVRTEKLFPFQSGIFVHRTVSNSIQAAFPKESAFLYKRRVILKVKASGGVRIFGNKLSFEVVKPVAVVCELPRSKEIMNKVLSQMANRSIDQEPISKMYKSLRQSRMMESKGSYR